MLLTRQKRSGVYRKNSKLILPVDTVKNYHLDRTFFQSQIVDGEFFPKKEYRVDGKKIETITALYKLLLEKGWSEETCFDAEWNPNNPSIGQSPATALLVQEIFGGNIIRYAWKKQVHYFNRITGKNFDLTSQERYDHPFDDYDGCVEVGISKKAATFLKRKRYSHEECRNLCVERREANGAK